MGLITYTLQNFDYQKALSGKLCVMVSDSHSKEDPIQSDALDFGGAGICRKSGSSNVSLTVNGEEFIFSREGTPSSANAHGANAHDAHYKLWLATTDTVVTDIGTTVNSNSNTPVTRGQPAGSVDYNAAYNTPKTVDTLYPRDQFAAQALRGILSHIDNPAALSKNEMDYYCNAAYEWAGLMMTAAANARPSSVNNGETQPTSETVPVSTLDNNTEILLNNMLVEFEKTDTNIDTPENPVLAKRVDVPRLINWLTAYQSYQEGGETKTVGLYDLVKAIKDIGSGSSGSSFDGKITEMPDVNISIKGPGSDNNHPIYISGGGFPTKDALAASFGATTLKSFVTFNESGAVGWSNNANVAAALLNASGANDIFNKIETLINARIEAYINASNVTVGGTTYNLHAVAPTT